VLTAWYVITSIIGIILGIVAIVAGFLMFASLFAIRDLGVYTLWIWGICGSIIAFVIFINITIPKYYVVKHCEISNIVSYEGIVSEHSGKSVYDYMTFMQGTDNSYHIYKINPNNVTVHYHTSSKTKVIENIKCYTSIFQGFAIGAMDTELTYDVYIPK
jgi:hypothetical protein